MKFGLFYEHQLPKPWRDGDEHRLIQDALDQVELADKLGYDNVWAVEHHFLEEYSHSSAPEVFLAACSQRTKRMRIGHGIVQMPSRFNHPARVAERIATLNLVSSGRVEWGTGEGNTALELEGFNVPYWHKREMWQEGTAEAANMLAMTPYPGFDGKSFSMPCRNIVPKSMQKPHPPMWIACSRRETIHFAARNGIGALTFAFVDPDEAKKWVSEYYDILKRECVPIGHVVNPNVAMVAGFTCHPDQQEAIMRGLEGFRFFNYALAHLYVFGEHQPGVTNIWDMHQHYDATMPNYPPSPCIGTPDYIRKHLREFADAGVDQMVFIQQSGHTRHEHIIDSLQLFAADVMPEFHAGEAEREAKKQAELAPYIEAALARKVYRKPLTPEETPVVTAYPRRVSAHPEQVRQRAVEIMDEASGVKKT